MNLFPHCDARILHAPGECVHCDELPDLQEVRWLWGLAFSGHTPTIDQLPCPADRSVAEGRRGDYNNWRGNIAVVGQALSGS